MSNIKSYRRYYSGELVLAGGKTVPVIFLTPTRPQIVDKKVVAIRVNPERRTLPGMMTFDLLYEDEI